jgi:hypothetical protein
VRGGTGDEPVLTPSIDGWSIAASSFSRSASKSFARHRQRGVPRIDHPPSLGGRHFVVGGAGVLETECQVKDCGRW